MNEAKPLHFLNGGGTMGELIRKKNWRASAIGEPETWPSGLKTAVSILLNSQFPMFIWWGPDLITIYNDAYRAIAGEKHPSLLGRSGKEAWAEIWPDLEPLVKSVFNGNATWSEDQPLYMNRHGFVEETYFTFSYSPVWGESGTVAGLYCACIETTEKVMAARRIVESERNLRATILQAPVAMCILKGPSFVLEIANDSMFELWGRGAADLLQRPIFDGLPEARNQGLEELLHQVYTTGESFTANEHPVLFPRNGVTGTVYINFVYRPFREGDGTITGIISVAVDVTNQVTARLKIEESERKFRSLVELAPVAISVVTGPENIVDIVNAKMGELLGKAAAELLGRPVFDSLPETRSQGFEQLLQHVYRTGERLAANEHPLVLLQNGKEERRFINFVYEPIKELDGSVGGVMTVAIDVTEQVTARRKIEESSEELQLAIAVADLGTFRVDLVEDKAIYSQRIMDWFGFTSQGQSIRALISGIHPDDRQKVLRALQASGAGEKGGQHDITFRVLHTQAGAERILHSTGRTYFNDNGKPYLMVGMIQDVTPQVQYRLQLEESEAELQKRVEERTLELRNLNNELKRTNQNLEEFAYAASHDMKEPIRKIHLFADRLKQELQDKLTESQQHLFSRVENAARRMNTLIEDLLTYSHISRGVSHMERVDLNKKVQLVLEDLEVSVEEKGALVTVHHLPTILAHRRQIQQLFQNLIGNALKYSKPDIQPEVVISAKTVQGHQVPLPLKEDEAMQQFHLIEVADNGIGFEQEDAERIFNVFTRLHGNAEYKGTGIGLSIVKKVVENHRGHIWAVSAPGAGTTFKLLFPVS